MAKQYKRECEGKVPHRTREAAHSALRHMLRRRGGRGAGMSIYRCRGCSYFHFGHRAVRKRVAY